MMTGPSRTSSVWSREHDQQLVDARKHRQNWVTIQQTHFPDKTPNACRKRHERLMERRNVDEWDSQKLELVAKEYMLLRKQMWSMLADRVGEKWQVVESKCLEKGYKNLQAAARSAARKDQSSSNPAIGMLKPPYPQGASPTGKENYTSGQEGYGDFSFLDSGMGIGDEGGLNVAPGLLGEHPMRAGN